MSLAIESHEIGKRFGSHWALSHVDLQIKRGESVALFGDNGSGKTTLLKLLATLMTPSAGRLKILGYEAGRQKSEIRKQIRFLAHEKQLYGTLTVLENLKLAAGIRGLQGRQRDTQLEEVMEQLQIGKVRERRVLQLSEGMKKRVVLARLLLGDAELILLDEPHPTLDAEGRKILHDLIRQWQRAGKTILLASHDHETTLAYVQRLIVIRSGQVRYDGPPAEWRKS